MLLLGSRGPTLQPGILPEVIYLISFFLHDCQLGEERAGLRVGFRPTAHSPVTTHLSSFLMHVDIPLQPKRPRHLPFQHSLVISASTPWASVVSSALFKNQGRTTFLRKLAGIALSPAAVFLPPPRHLQTHELPLLLTETAVTYSGQHVGCRGRPRGLKSGLQLGDLEEVMQPLCLASSRFSTSVPQSPQEDSSKHRLLGPSPEVLIPAVWVGPENLPF